LGFYFIGGPSGLLSLSIFCLLMLPRLNWNVPISSDESKLSNPHGVLPKVMSKLSCIF